MSNEKSSWGQQSQSTIWERADETSYVRPQPETAAEVGVSIDGDSSPVLGNSVELDITESRVDEAERKHVGFATEPGYVDDFNAWGGRKVDQNPKYM